MLKREIGVGFAVGPEQAVAAEAISTVARTLVEAVRNTFVYYSGNNPGAAIEVAIMTGGGSHLPGLGQYLSSAGRLPVTLGDPLAGLKMGKSMPRGSLAGFEFHHRSSYDVACNWKVYVDNYLEGYHVPHIHPGLNSLLDYRSYITETAEWYSFQFSPLEISDDLYGSGEALYYFLYPNAMLNILPGRLQTNRVLPLGVDHCRVEFDFYYAPAVTPEALARRAKDIAFSDEVQDEDVTICEDVQRGLASGSYEAGRLNPLRENAVHHFHELLRRTYRNTRAST